MIALGLRNRGINLITPDISGYTQATGIRNPDWQTWQQTALDFIASAGDPNEPIILGGLCMGGVLAAAAALRTRRKIAGLILLSPTFDYDGWGLSPITHLRHFGYWTGIDRFFNVHEREPYGVKNPKVRQWVKREMIERASAALGPARIPLRALREGERMMKYVRQQLSTLNCPLLIIHAKEDEITTLGSVEKLFTSLGQPDKTLIVVENSYHMITIDNDRHAVAQAIENFSKRVTTTHRITPDQPILQRAA